MRARSYASQAAVVRYIDHDGVWHHLRGERVVIEALGHRDGQTVTPERADLIMEAHAILDQAEIVLRDYTPDSGLL